jgi:hypothetical protein
MSKFMRRQARPHNSSRVGWLRAAVLGANDGIVSTASLLIGVAAAGTTHIAVMATARKLPGGYFASEAPSNDRWSENRGEPHRYGEARSSAKAGEFLGAQP